MLGRITVIQDDKKAIFIQLDQPANFKMGELIDIKKHRRNRTLSQNRLYFAFLSWCISREGGDLISQGHWSVDGLHSDIKFWIASEHPHQFNVDKLFSSAELNTKEFGEFIDIVDRELMVKFFGIDTDRFFGDGEKGEIPF
jgi:hypothetical protein